MNTTSLSAAQRYTAALAVLVLAALQCPHVWALQPPPTAAAASGLRSYDPARIKSLKARHASTKRDHRRRVRAQKALREQIAGRLRQDVAEYRRLCLDAAVLRDDPSLKYRCEQELRPGLWKELTAYTFACADVVAAKAERLVALAPIQRSLAVEAVEQRSFEHDDDRPSLPMPDALVPTSVIGDIFRGTDVGSVANKMLRKVHRAARAELSIFDAIRKRIYPRDAASMRDARVRYAVQSAESVLLGEFYGTMAHHYRLLARSMDIAPPPGAPDDIDGPDAPTELPNFGDVLNTHTGADWEAGVSGPEPNGKASSGPLNLKSFSDDAL